LHEVPALRGTTTPLADLTSRSRALPTA
jgi:hypothetical protein